MLFKLLFTREALSIQVHPDDDAARAMGLTRGKTEAWYVLAAEPGATVAVGLLASLSQAQLRAAIGDGSILQQVSWRKVVEGDVIFVPAGTIHAIGPGLVLAEIQQRSDTTFRLFDHGRGRELHIESGIAAANAGPAAEQAPQRGLGNARTLLVASAFFVLERLELAPGSVWKLRARPETWLIVIAGDGCLGPMQAGVGDGCFAEAETMRIAAGQQGLTCLIAYAAAVPSGDLLRPLAANDALTSTSAESRRRLALAAPAVSPIPLMEARP
ncbi:hypothetical protein ASE66_18415 [Bosea sp. Root483D1]|nr:hypothetical protein ASE66_18415 [Bosea sp. Root483D1]